MSLSYIHMYDSSDKDIDRIRWFAKNGPIEVGMIIEKSAQEGYIPYRVISLQPLYQFETESAGTVHGYKAVVQQQPYVKTHCAHDWVIDGKSIALGTPFQFYRHCDKCQQKQGYNIGIAKWEDFNEG
mgnify:CR=1 FL=1